MENNIINDDYSKFDDVSLMVVREFFTDSMLKDLIIKYNILTLGDLFEKTANGQLQEMIERTRNITPIGRCELYKVILGTVNILKCKYFNVDPMLDEQSSRADFFEKLGIEYFNGLKFDMANIKYFGQLLEMARTGDFQKIYSMRLMKDRTESIINKIKVVYNFLYRNVDEKLGDQDIIEKDMIVTIDEIKILYNELQRLTKESNRINAKIDDIQSKIDERMNHVKKLTR